MARNKSQCTRLSKGAEAFSSITIAAIAGVLYAFSLPACQPNHGGIIGFSILGLAVVSTWRTFLRSNSCPSVRVFCLLPVACLLSAGLVLDGAKKLQQREFVESCCG